MVGKSAATAIKQNIVQCQDIMLRMNSQHITLQEHPSTQLKRGGTFSLISLGSLSTTLSLVKTIPLQIILPELTLLKEINHTKSFKAHLEGTVRERKDMRCQRQDKVWFVKMS